MEGGAVLYVVWGDWICGCTRVYQDSSRKNAKHAKMTEEKVMRAADEKIRGGV
jgi:hypothetical protein